MKTQLTENIVNSLPHKRQMLQKLGVSWPLSPGWKKRLIGKVVDSELLPIKTKETVNPFFG